MAPPKSGRARSVDRGCDGTASSNCSCPTATGQLLWGESLHPIYVPDTYIMETFVHPLSEHVLVLPMEVVARIDGSHVWPKNDWCELYL